MPTPTAPVPAGHLRHPVSGCVIPEAEGPLHDAAVAMRRAAHARAERPTDKDAQLAAAQAAAQKSAVMAAEAVAAVETLGAKLEKALARVAQLEAPAAKPEKK